MVLFRNLYMKVSLELIEFTSYEDQDSTKYLEQAARIMKERCVFACFNGLSVVVLGIGPSHLQIGDQLLQDGRFRYFVVRKQESSRKERSIVQGPTDDTSYELVGNCVMQRYWTKKYGDFNLRTGDTIMFK